MPRVYLRKPPAERFWPKVEKGYGCWIWKGAPHSNGYGMFQFQGRMQTAHRVAYFLANDLDGLPPDIDVCHTCDNRKCVNPAHLFLGTRKQNMEDAVAKGRAWSPLWEQRRQITHCPQGHPYSPENTYRPVRGERQCRECNRAHNRAWTARQEP